MREHQDGSGRGGHRGIEVGFAHQAVVDALDDARVAGDLGQPEGLQPITGVGAHGVPHQGAGDVFGANNPAQVFAKLVHSLAVIAGVVGDAGAEGGGEWERESPHYFPAHEIGLGG